MNNQEGSRISYKDLPVLYIKYSGLKKLVTSLFAMTGLFGGMMLGLEVYVLLQGSFLHPRPLFGFLAGFGFLMGMCSLAMRLEKFWNMQDKSILTEVTEGQP